MDEFNVEYSDEIELDQFEENVNIVNNTSASAQQNIISTAGLTEKKRYKMAKKSFSYL